MQAKFVRKWDRFIIVLKLGSCYLFQFATVITKQNTVKNDDYCQSKI